MQEAFENDGCDLVAEKRRSAHVLSLSQRPGLSGRFGPVHVCNFF